MFRRLPAGSPMLARDSKAERQFSIPRNRPSAASTGSPSSVMTARDPLKRVTVSDRSFVGFSVWAVAPRSLPASVRQGPAPGGRHGSSDRPDRIPACRRRGGSVLGTLDTSRVASRYSEKKGTVAADGWSNGVAASQRKNHRHFAVALSAFSRVELSVPDSSLGEGGALNELHGPRAEA